MWGRRAVGEIRHSDVQSWISKFSTEDKPRSATTILRAYGVLAGILDVAVHDRRILTNPARGINLPRKLKKEHRYLTHAEVGRLAENSGKHRFLVYVFASTGLRWGEAIGLRVRDIDPTGKRFNISVNAVEVGADIELGTPRRTKGVRWHTLLFCLIRCRRAAMASNPTTWSSATTSAITSDGRELAVGRGPGSRRL